MAPKINNESFRDGGFYFGSGYGTNDNGSINGNSTGCSTGSSGVRNNTTIVLSVNVYGDGYGNGPLEGDFTEGT